MRLANVVRPVNESRRRGRRFYQTADHQTCTMSHQVLSATYRKRVPYLSTTKQNFRNP